MKLWSMLAAATLLFAFTTAQAEDKEVTLKGTITCAKCDLKKEAKCATVIVAKEGEKEAVFYFDTDSDKKHHKAICTEAKKGTVKGTVSEKDGKKWIKVTDVKFD